LEISSATTLPIAGVGALYSTTLAASGGTPPYVWSLAPGSTLPTGLSLSNQGALAGTPSAAGKSSFVVIVHDAAGHDAQAQLSLTVDTLIITAFAPVLCDAGSSAFTLDVSGAAFASGAHVVFDGTSLATTFVSQSKLTAIVGATLVSGAGYKKVTVVNPGGATATAANQFWTERPPAAATAGIVCTATTTHMAGGTCGVATQSTKQETINNVSCPVNWNGRAITLMSNVLSTCMIVDVPFQFTGTNASPTNACPIGNYSVGTAAQPDPQGTATLSGDVVTLSVSAYFVTGGCDYYTCSCQGSAPLY
jgi:hypothetical protein